MNKFVTIARNSVLAIAATAALVAVPASAETAPTVKVAYGDLNLSSPAGQQHLQARLHSAARAVCGIESGATLPNPARVACAKKAIAQADVEFAALVGTNQPRVAIR